MPNEASKTNYKDLDSTTSKIFGAKPSSIKEKTKNFGIESIQELQSNKDDDDFSIDESI